MNRRGRAGARILRALLLAHVRSGLLIKSLTWLLHAIAAIGYYISRSELTPGNGFHPRDESVTE